MDFPGHRVRPVSIHAPTRGATLYFILAPVLFPVSIHAPTRGATLSSHSVITAITVSIHAPTRGATLSLQSLRMSAKFQSTLPRGERHTINRYTDSMRSFNPRSHAGSDAIQPDAERHGPVSIHAPTRGATGFDVVIDRTNMFQSTLPRGERLHHGNKRLLAKMFQSTLPRGERLRHWPGVCRLLPVSIHAPTRGATGCLSVVCRKRKVSIHAPTRGATGRESSNPSR